MAACFEDDSGKTSPVDGPTLEALFALFNKRIECVVLNACFSQKQAQAIVRTVPYVVGMRLPIGDQAAIAFSSGFYRAIANYRSIEDAFQFGLVEMRLLGIPEHETPILLRNPDFGNPIVEVQPRVDQHKRYRTVRVTRPPGRVMVDTSRHDDGQRLLVDIDAFPTVGELLEALFMGFLSERFAPFSYGREWLLVSEWGPHVLAPISWLQAGCIAVSRVDPEWMTMRSLNEVGVDRDSRWKIESVETVDDYIAVIAKDERLRKALCTHPKAIAMVDMTLATDSEIAAAGSDESFVLRNRWHLPFGGKVVLVSPPDDSHFWDFFGRF